jgi:hypothetical protein
MDNLLKCIEVGQNKNDLLVLSLTRVNLEVHLSFLLFCQAEGTVYGQRTFLTTTLFDGPDDLVEELWLGKLVSVPVSLNACIS